MTPPVAVLVAARDAPSQAQALATLSRAVQTNLVSPRELADARRGIGDKWCRRFDAALADIGAGVRSVAEKDAYTWIRSSSVLPVPTWNQWLDLGDGGAEICTDVLIKEAAMVHEVNGKKAHAWGEQFENTHVKIERLSAAGLVPTQATALRWRRHGAAVLANVERVYLQNKGRAWPENVKLIDPPEWFTRRVWLNRG
jgi:hypothetical protein